VGSPVYKGTYTGLFKHFFDLLDQDSLVDLPVLLTATGGSDRHALVLDHGLRPLFSFFRAQTLPWGLYANSSDFDGYTVTSEELAERIDSTAKHAAALLERRVRD
jgi:FMN reductase